MLPQMTRNHNMSCNKGVPFLKRVTQRRVFDFVAYNAGDVRTGTLDAMLTVS